MIDLKSSMWYRKSLWTRTKNFPNLIHSRCASSLQMCLHREKTQITRRRKSSPPSETTQWRIAELAPRVSFASPRNKNVAPKSVFWVCFSTAGHAHTNDLERYNTQNGSSGRSDSGRPATTDRSERVPGVWVGGGGYARELLLFAFGGDGELWGGRAWK